MTESEKIATLLEQNRILLEENNKMLHRMYRWSIMAFVARIVWYILIIGIPFVLYYFLFQPYISTSISNYESFRDGIHNIPSLQGLEYLLPKIPVGN